MILDNAFVIDIISHHMHSPKEIHLKTIYKILRYLKGSPGKQLFFKKSEINNIEFFTDTEWTGLIEDKRSTTKYCTFVFKNLVTWRNKKQNVVTRNRI